MVETKQIGFLDGKNILEYILSNKKGTRATFLNLGGTNTKLIVKNKKGMDVDIVMSYDELEHIKEDPCFFGAIIARNGNRIANATAKIDGKEYKLIDNDNGNNLHSGNDYFHSHILDAKFNDDEKESYVEFLYKFKDMEQGYPGNMDFSIRYTLTEENELKLTYKAKSDKDTIFNTTWHAYFNFRGHNFSKIDTHELKLEASKFTYVNDVLIPEKIEPVKNTTLDFNTDFRNMGDGIDDNSYIQIKRAGGFDHNYCIDNYDGSIRKAATVREKESGIKMEVYTDLPGIQFYSGNFIDCPYNGKEGTKYIKRGAFCLETQYFPNAINDDRFVSPLLKANTEKESHTIYKFSLI